MCNLLDSRHPVLLVGGHSVSNLSSRLVILMPVDQSDFIGKVVLIAP